MTEQPKPDKKSSSDGLHVDVDHLSVTGHVVFAGRDGTVNVNTGGDVAQNTENSITVGGVETTRESYDQMASTIETVQQRFETDEVVDDDTKEAARHYIETIKKLLLSNKKPNPQILVTTVKSLAKLGPLFVSGISEVFGEPLAAQIVEGMGHSTSNFFKAFMAKFGS